MTLISYFLNIFLRRKKLTFFFPFRARVIFSSEQPLKRRTGLTNRQNNTQGPVGNIEDLWGRE